MMAYPGQTRERNKLCFSTAEFAKTPDQRCTAIALHRVREQSTRQNMLVGIEPERPHRRADDEQNGGDDERRLPIAELHQEAEHIGDSAPPILPAMFIMPETVPEYLPPVSMGTAQDGPMVHSRKNIEAVRQ